MFGLALARGLPVDAVAMQLADDARFGPILPVLRPVGLGRPGRLFAGIGLRRRRGRRGVDGGGTLDEFRSFRGRRGARRVGGPGRLRRGGRLVGRRHGQAARLSGLSGCGHQNHRCDQNEFGHMKSPPWLSGSIGLTRDI